jgi:hypothetical protein
MRELIDRRTCAQCRTQKECTDGIKNIEDSSPFSEWHALEFPNEYENNLSLHTPSGSHILLDFCSLDCLYRFISERVENETV